MAVVLRVTAIGAGSVEYLLRGCGCAEHEHAPEIDQGLELGEELEHKHGHDHKHDQAGGREQTGADYLSKNAGQSPEHEPAGMWWGEGLEMVAREAGTRARASDVRGVFGELRHPDSSAKEPEFLGSKPRVFKSTEERIEAALAAEPDASEERIWQIRTRIGGDQRNARAYYDLTFSAPKSVSVYYAALLATGREADAQRLWEMHQAAVDEAMGFIQAECSYVRSGYHGKTRDGRSVGRYEEGSGLVGIRFDHRTSRAQEPQLHSHFAVLNRVTTSSDGKIRALDGRGFAPILEGADALYLRGLERRMTTGFPVVFSLRPDGMAREILGVSQRLCAEASTRRAQVLERTEQLVADYRAREGQDPRPAVLKRLRQEATLSTRAPKSARPPLRQITAWNRPRTSEVRAVVPAAAAHANDPGRIALSDQRNQIDRARREELLRSAVWAAQAKNSTWTLGNLIKEISLAQADTPWLTDSPEDLAREVVTSGDRYGLVAVSAPDPGPIPESLREADGRARYRAHNHERYATAAQLEVENAIVAGARTTDAPALGSDRVELVRSELVAHGLGDDQLAAALGVLTSGRRGDVLIGPAGVGKSRTVAGLGAVWERHLGGRVLGLATSQRATDVLAHENGMTALNVATFLERYSPDDEGLVSERVRAGDLFVLDEAGMVSTADLKRVSEIVAAGGGKLLYTGDTAQLAAVGAGGMLDLLVRDNGAYQLVEVHRFVHDWEKAASVRLRDGDVSALDQYNSHGRLRGGTAEQVADAATRGYLADVVEGKSSMIVVETNAQATELSGQVRAELLRLGRVAPEVLDTLRDGNHVGVGDLVQARQNAYQLRVDGLGMVTNREIYTVLGTGDLGTLRVRSATGAVAYLPAQYVREHVTLAYAATVHSVQGVTLDTSHALVSQRSRLRSVYVAMTRGREANTAYVETQVEPDHHQVTRINETPGAILTKIMERQASEDAEAIKWAAAELTRRVGVESAASLASVGTQWDLLTTEVARERYVEQLQELLPEHDARRVVAEPGFNQFVHALRASELAGHDTRAALAEAITERSLGDVDSMSDVLRFRINKNRDHRTPEREVRAGDWATLSGPIDGPRGEWARVLAHAATAEQTRLGAAAWAQPPAWALHLLGTPPAGHSPADQAQTQEWITRAGTIAAYRDLANISGTALSLGAAPSREQVFHRALWQQAFTAAGCPADDLDYRMATDTELYAMRRRYNREETWAPYFVGQELATTREDAAIHRQDAQLWRAEAVTYPDGSAEREQAEVDARTAEQAARLAEARAEQLQLIHERRAEWSGSVVAAQTAYEKAGEELERRGLGRDPQRVTEEQPGLFEVLEHGSTTTAGDRNQLELELEGESLRREPVTVTRVDVARTEDPQLPDTLELTEDPNQRRLFAAEPDSSAIAGAQPLRAEVGADRDPSRQHPARARETSAGQSAVTLAEARRQAEISADLRAGRDLRAQTRRWEHDQQDREVETLAARTRRDRDDEQGHDLEHALTAREDGPGRSLRFNA